MHVTLLVPGRIGVTPDSCHLKHLCIPHNACPVVCLNFILIRRVTSGDNHTSLSERAALRGKHFESSDYINGGSLKGDCTQAKGSESLFWLYERLNVKESKSSYCKLAKATILIITVQLKDCCNSVVPLSVPGRDMNTSTCSIYKGVNHTNQQLYGQQLV